MNSPSFIANNLRAVHFGPNWPGVCLKEKVADLRWEQAIQQIDGYHSIATLVFHMNYYIDATIKVFHGEPLEAKDSLSFEHARIENADDWETLLGKTWSDAEELASLIEQMPESQLQQDFVESKNGTYYRCLVGPIEHCYYHLGQISLLRRHVKK